MSLRGKRCERCEGDGSYSELAPCTSAGSDCACNGPRVIVDPCPDCNGTGGHTQDCQDHALMVHAASGEWAECVCGVQA